MRYRSATVADSHGLPLNLKRNKRTGERCAGSANSPAPRNLFICAFFANTSASRSADSIKFYARPLATTAVLFPQTFAHIY
jgi:hypothetical protein